MINIKTDIIRYEIEPWMNEKSLGFHNIGQLNKNSFCKGEGNYGGKLGECLVYKYLHEKLGDKISWADVRDYDFIIKNGSKQFTIDNKSKYQTVDSIKDFFDASVSTHSLHQKCDIYTFTRWHKLDWTSGDYGWVIGWITKDKYFDLAKTLNKGDADGKNNWNAKVDCYNIKYNLLEPMPTLINFVS